MQALRIGDYRSSKLADPEVVKRVIAGEKPLFEILMRRHNQMLYRVVRGYLKDKEEVQDVMQNTYMKAFDKLFQFQGNASFSTWLIRIGINEALMRLKDMKKAKGVYMNMGDLNEHDVNQIPDRQLNPEKKIIGNETIRLVEDAIDHLPEAYRIVYILREIEQLPTEEVCETLGLTESNLKVRLHRAKAMLKDNLLQLSSGSAVFEFGNARCDAVVDYVMSRI